jgi:hypothetical protein
MMRKLIGLTNARAGRQRTLVLSRAFVFALDRVCPWRVNVHASRSTPQ